MALLNLSEIVAHAIDLERNGDLEGALNEWYATVGAFPITSTSKDGHTVTFSGDDRNAKIAQLEKRIAKAAGHGKVKRIPIEYTRVDGGSVVYDEHGYAWGYR